MPKVGSVTIDGAYWKSQGQQVELYLGDVLQQLRKMPAGSVQCAVTSPPYWGLRDYGTGTWEGGDPKCSHKINTTSDPSRLVSKEGHTPVAGCPTRDTTVRLNSGHKSNPVHKEGYKSPFPGTATGGSSYLEQGKMTAGAVPNSRDCPLGCGARCEDHQLGSEKCPDCLGWARGVNCAEQDWANACHVCRMVLVFRELRRVLRDDGTMWVNYGSTYFSGAGGKNPSQSPSSSRVPACGTDGIKPGDSQVSDSFYRDLCDGCLSVLSIRRVRNGLPPLEFSSLPEQTNRGSVRAGFSEASPASSLPSSPQSTIPSSLSSGPAALPRVGGASGRRTAAQTSDHLPPLSSHKKVCNVGTSQKDGSSVRHNQGKELSCKACGNSFKERVGCTSGNCTTNYPPSMYTSGDLVAVPWLVALALQADGWILRSDIPWVKRSSMPESVRNRPAKALEYVFLFAKKMGYFYDCEAVRRVTGNELSEEEYAAKTAPGATWESGGQSNYAGAHKHDGGRSDANGRAWRNADLWFQSVETPHGMTWVDDEIVGLDVTSQSYEGSHFATFGGKLIEPMIKAGTSEKGACAKCGAPWKRVVGKASGGAIGSSWHPHDDDTGKGNFKVVSSDGYVAAKTIGWEPTCECHGRFEKREMWVERPVSLEKNVGDHEKKAQTQGDLTRSTLRAPKEVAQRDRSLPQNRNGITGSLDGVDRPIEKVKQTKNVYIPSIPLEDHPTVPCVVLDPFMGSGTTALVALELGLKAVGIDLSKEYLERHAIARVKTWFINKRERVVTIQSQIMGEEG